MTGSSATTAASTSSSSGGCDTDAECPSGDACIHADGLCGKGGKGACEKKVFPPCPATAPACFCDGTVGEPCGTYDVSKDPSLCSQGTFPCGGLMCKKYIEYCVPPQAQPAGGGPAAGCLTAPPTCTYGIVSCGCLEANGPGNMCSSDGQGDVTVYYATAG